MKKTNQVHIHTQKKVPLLVFNRRAFIVGNMIISLIFNSMLASVSFASGSMDISTYTPNSTIAGTLWEIDLVDNLNITTTGTPKDVIFSINSADCEFDGDIDSTIENITKNGDYKLTLFGDPSYTGLTTIASGSLVFKVFSATMGNVVVQSGAEFVASPYDDTTYTGVISSGGSFTKDGLANFTLTQDQTYTGGTKVLNGILTLSGSIDASSGIEVDGTVAFAYGADLVYDKVITGSGGVIQSGSAVLTLSDQNTYTGTTTISSGVLVGGMDTSTGLWIGDNGTYDLYGETRTLQGLSGTGLIKSTGSDAELILNLLSSCAFSGTIHSSIATLTKAGEGTFLLDGATYTGALTINEGFVQGDLSQLSAIEVNSSYDVNGSAATLPNLSGSGTILDSVSTDKTVTLNSTLASEFSGTIAPTIQDIIKSGAGVLSLSGEFQNTGTLTIQAGGLKILTSIPTLALENDGSVIYALTEDETHTGEMSGAGSLIQEGSATLALHGTYSYTGPTVVSSGNLTLKSSIETSSGIETNANVIFAYDDDVTYDKVVSGTGSLTQNGIGTLTLSQENTYTGDTIITSGILKVTGGIDTSNAILNNSVLIFAYGEDDVFEGVISGTGSVTQNGIGVLSLLAQNTYTGNTSIASGTLRGDISLSEFVVIGTGAFYDLYGVDAQLCDLGGEGTVQDTLNTNKSLTINSVTGSTFSGVLASSLGSVIKIGEGILTLDNESGYTGNFVISEGSIEGDLSSASSVQVDSYYDLQGVNGTLYNLTGTGTVKSTNADAGLTLYVTQDCAFDGTLETSISTLTKMGDYDLVLNGTPYQGGLIVGEGDLSGDVSAASYLSLSAGAGYDLKGQDSHVNDLQGLGVIKDTSTPAATLTIGGLNGSEFLGEIEDSIGGIIKVGAQQLKLNGTNNYSAPTVISEGSLIGDISQSSAVTVNGIYDLDGENRTLKGISGTGVIQSFSAPADLTLFVVDNADFGGTFASSIASITKTGSGFLTLENLGFFVGDVVISEGTLIGDTSLATSLVVNGMYDLNGVSATLLNVSGTGQLQSVSTPVAVTFEVSTASTFAGTFDVSILSVTKTGSEKLTLNGADDYTGAILVSAGTLAGNIEMANVEINGVYDLDGQEKTLLNITGSGTIQSSTTDANLIIHTTQDSSFAGGIASSIVNLTKTGDYILTLAGENAFTGIMSITAGSVRGDLSSASSLVIDGIYDLYGSALELSDISGTGSIEDTSGLSAVLTVNAASPVVFAGELDSSLGGLVKTGDESLTLSTAVAYTGSTTISAGTLIGDISSSQSVSVDGVYDLNGEDRVLVDISGAGVIEDTSGDQAVLTITSNNGSIFEGTLASSLGGIVKTGDNVLTLSGTNSCAGNFTISQGDVRGDLSQAAAVIINGVYDLYGTNRELYNISGSGTITDSVLITSILTLNISQDSTFDGVFNNVIGGITKCGTNKLTVSSALSYTGTITISQGALEIVQSIDSPQVENGGELIFSQTDDYTYAGVINGVGSVSKTGPGMLTFSQSQTFTGNTTVNAGTLQLLGDLTSDITLSDETLVDFAITSEYTHDNDIIGLGGITQSGASLLTFSSALSHAGVLSISAGTVKLLDSTQSSEISNDTNLILAPAQDTNYPSIISGSGTVTKEGVFSAVLQGVNTYTGDTIISAGTLAGNISTSQSVTVAQDAFYDINGESQEVVNISGSGGIKDSQSSSALITLTLQNVTAFQGDFDSSLGGVSKTGTGSLTLEGVNSCEGALLISEGVLKGDISLFTSVEVNSIYDFNGTSLTLQNLSGTGELTSSQDNVDVTLHSTANSLYAGTFSGVDSITKTGTATLTLSTISDFGGSITISQGTLIADLSAATNVLIDATYDLNGEDRTLIHVSGSGEIKDSSGSPKTVTFDIAEDLSFTGNISTVGGLIKKGTDTILSLEGDNTYTAKTTISEGTLKGNIEDSTSVEINGTYDLNGTDSSLQNISGTGVISSSVTNAALTVTTTQDSVFEGTLLFNISDLIKEGTASLALNGTNTHSGATKILYGTLSGDISACDSVLINGTYDLVGVNQTISDVSGSGMITSSTASADLTIVMDSIDSEFLGTLDTSILNLTKSGGYALYLHGTNNYTGTTTILDGILGGNISQSSAVCIDGVYDLDGVNRTLSSISGTGMIQDSSGSSCILTITGSDDDAFSGTLDDTLGGLIKTGENTLTLSGVNEYTGPTTITQGVLIANLSASSDVIVNAIYDLAGNNRSLYNLQGTGEIKSSLIDAVITLLSTNNNTFAGTFASTISQITKGSEYTLTLTASQDYAGSILIEAGTLIGDISSASLEIAEPAFYDLKGTAGTLLNLTGQGTVQSSNANTALIIETTQASLFSGTLASSISTVTKTGDGVFTFNAATAYAGPIIIEAGALQGDISDASSVSISEGGIYDVNGVPLSVTDLSGSGMVKDTSGGNNILTITSQVGSTFEGTLDDSLGGMIKMGNETLILKGEHTYTEETTVSQGTLNIKGVLASSLLNNQATLIFSPDDDLTYEGVISGVNGFTKTGIANLTLTNTHLYTGSATVSGGTLTITGQLNSASDIINNATVVIDKDTDFIFDVAISGSGDVTTQGEGNITLSGTHTYDGVTTIVSGTLTVVGDITGTGGIVNMSALVFELTADQIYTLGFSGTGSLTHNSDITLSLNGANTYTGTTTIAQGILMGDISSSGGVEIVSTYDLNGTNRTLLNATGTGTIQSSTQSASLTLENSAASTFSGTIASTISNFIKCGDGTLTLNGLNVYSGTTTVSEGTLKIISLENLGAGSIILLDNAALEMEGEMTFDHDITFAQTSAIAVAEDGMLTYSSPLTQTYAFIKKGLGTITLSADNSSGTASVDVREGTLLLSSMNQIPSDTLILSGGTLKLAVGGEFSKKITLNANSTLDLNGFDVTVMQDMAMHGYILTIINSGDEENTLTIDGTANDSTGGFNIGDKCILSDTSDVFTDITIQEGGKIAMAHDASIQNLFNYGVLALNGYPLLVAGRNAILGNMTDTVGTGYLEFAESGGAVIDIEEGFTTPLMLGNHSVLRVNSNMSLGRIFVKSSNS